MQEKHLQYFNDVLRAIKHSVNVNIPIIPCDHETIKGHEKALGICHGTHDGNFRNWGAEKITIDEYFIEECYEAEINGKWWIAAVLENKTLIDVICHEIAHIHALRHGKKHTELTNRLIESVRCGRPHGIEPKSA